MRRKLRIRSPFAVIGWTQAEEALLGTMPDEELARKLSRAENTVRVKRCKLGIPNPSGPCWTAEELALLGTARMPRSRP
jgi:hypothetical protein